MPSKHSRSCNHGMPFGSTTHTSVQTPHVHGLSRSVLKRGQSTDVPGRHAKSVAPEPCQLPCCPPRWPPDRGAARRYRYRVVNCQTPASGRIPIARCHATRTSSMTSLHPVPAKYLLCQANTFGLPAWTTPSRSSSGKTPSGPLPPSAKSEPGAALRDCAELSRQASPGRDASSRRGGRRQHAHHRTLGDNSPPRGRVPSRAWAWSLRSSSPSAVRSSTRSRRSAPPSGRRPDIAAARRSPRAPGLRSGGPRCRSLP